MFQLNEMAFLYDFAIKKTNYLIKIHGGNNNERPLPPHIHIYGYISNEKVENIEVSLADYLEHNVFIPIHIDNFKTNIHLNDCDWSDNLRIFNKFESIMFSHPTNERYKDCIDYIQAAINVWNHETDPKTIRQELQYVPEPYRIIIAMREMNKTISIKNRRKYFKGIDIDGVIEKYYIPGPKKRR